jgi:hypothetical protein
MSDFIPWLRGLAEKGGKGVVNNIDARCLGRVADELTCLTTELDKAHGLLSQSVGWQHDTEIIKATQQKEIERLQRKVANYEVAVNYLRAELERGLAPAPIAEPAAGKEPAEKWDAEEAV